MKKFIILIVACLYATGALAYKYTVNNNTDGNILVIFNAVARPSDYELTVPANSTNQLDTEGYCIRGVNVISQGGQLTGEISDFKHVSGIVCKGYTISVQPNVATLVNPVMNTSEKRIVGLTVNYD